MSRVFFLCAGLALFGCGNDAFGTADDASADGARDGSAQDATPPGDAGDAGETSKPSACPGTAGPIGIHVRDGIANFCIDATEVTHAQYEAFVQSAAARAVLLQLPSFCPPMPVFGAPPVADPADFPARNISWCDAWAYCRYAGKRLCGRIGGGPSLTTTEQATAAHDEAYFACSRGGRQALPYGDTDIPGTCDDGFPDGGANPDASPGPVASWSGCVGGYPGLHDMVGGVDEFYDAVERNDAGAATYFGHRGGSWMSAKADCSLHSGIDVVSAKYIGIGFRCCADALP